jgi:micrococcal nuclease
VLPRLIAVVTIVLALVTATGCGRDAPAAVPKGATAVVERVVDGDTIRVRTADGRRERVRLIGIDTPETKDPRRPVQCFGKEASAYTARLLPPGTPVRLERDVELRDRYDRLLAYVYRARDGTFVNAALARDGYARPLTIPPNVAQADEFVAAAAEARDAGRGLWKSCSSPEMD